MPAGRWRPCTRPANATSSGTCAAKPAFTGGRFLGAPSTAPSDATLTTVVAVALGLLLHGAWATCFWRVERELANLWRQHLAVELKERPAEAGLLGLDVVAPAGGMPAELLPSARLPSEAASTSVDEIWQFHRSPLGQFLNSHAEEQFFRDILAPALGFPLVDSVLHQAELTCLGFDH